MKKLYQGGFFALPLSCFSRSHQPKTMRFAYLTLSLVIFIAIFDMIAAQSCHHLEDQKDIDECYMKIALDFAKIHNPQFPFGALIVDHTKNEISCFGANSNKKNKLLHGKSAFSGWPKSHLSANSFHSSPSYRRNSGFLEVSHHKK
jgi:hypothetical protein